ncbi:hypothetical protein A9976_04980 [Delftia sp. UME58]|nr:hypothetical protein [Delftia sp. UME58]
MIPFARPAADDQTMLVKDAIQQPVVGVGIGAQLLIGIQDTGILVVTVQFEQIAAAVGQRFGTSERIRRSNNRWFNPLFPESVLHKPVEIGGDNDSHIPSSNQLRNSVVCFGWRFPTFLAILLIWLDVAM